jgi:hypothetical protein
MHLYLLDIYEHIFIETIDIYWFDYRLQHFSQYKEDSEKIRILFPKESIYS